MSSSIGMASGSGAALVAIDGEPAADRSGERPVPEEGRRDDEARRPHEDEEERRDLAAVERHFPALPASWNA